MQKVKDELEPNLKPLNIILRRINSQFHPHAIQIFSVRFILRPTNLALKVTQFSALDNSTFSFDDYYI